MLEGSRRSQMNNKGVANHMKFRTKYWQERQTHAALPFNDTVVMGITIDPKPKTALASTPESKKVSRDISRGPSPPSEIPFMRMKRKEVNCREGRSSQYKLQLKLQLRSLNDDHFAVLREGIRSVEMSRRRECPEKTHYRGKSSLEKKRRGHLTIELDIGVAEMLR